MNLTKVFWSQKKKGHLRAIKIETTSCQVTSSMKKKSKTHNNRKRRTSKNQERSLKMKKMTMTTAIFD
jgi:hypothetical protein